MTHRLLIPVTPGELLDRITILRTKLRNIENREKLKKIASELAELTYVWDSSPYSIRTSAEVIRCLRELQDANQQIWDAEIVVRRDDGNVPLAARSARDGNDKRTALKATINKELDVETIEVKEYGGSSETQGQGS